MQWGLHTAPGLALVQLLSRLLLPGRSLLGAEPSHVALNINQLAQRSCQAAWSGSVPDIRAGRATPLPLQEGGAGLLATPWSHKRLLVPSALPPLPNHAWTSDPSPPYST